MRQRIRPRWTGPTIAIAIALTLGSAPAWADDGPEKHETVKGLTVDPDRPASEPVAQEQEALVGLSGAAGSTMRSSRAAAASFDHTLVISDYEFYRGDALDDAQIEQFIKAKGAQCRSTGDKTCLKDLTLPATSLVSDRAYAGCEPVTLPAGTRSWTAVAAVGRACNISPKVLLVTIQKESSGVAQPKTTAQWNKMMGMGCPDGGSCSAKFAGFAKQLYFGADRLYAYQNWTSYPFIKAYLQGIPTKPLDSDVAAFVPRSMATASLYTYTPWVSGNRLFHQLMGSYFPEALAAGPRAASIRWGGEDRIATAVTVSRQQWSSSTAKAVYLARADVTADAQVAGVLRNGPILLTDSRSVSPQVAAEISRLGDPQVVVIGGAGVVSDKVALTYSKGRPITRLGGAAREDTAIAVSRYAFPARSKPLSIYLADGYGRDGNGGPDGVAGGVLVDGPVLLVDPRFGPSATVRAEVARLKSLGARSVVSLGGHIAGYAFDAKLAGTSRYETAVAIARRVFPSKAATVYIANGESFVDAISGGSVTDGPILLVWGNAPESAVCDYIRKVNPRRVVALGGPGAVTRAAAEATLRCTA